MSRNATLETAIAEVTSLGDLSIRLKIVIQDVDFTPVKKETEKAVSEGLRLGLDTQSVAAIMSFASSGITIGKFLNPEMFRSINSLMQSIGNTATEAGPAISRAFTGAGNAFRGAGTAAIGFAGDLGHSLTTTVGNAFTSVGNTARGARKEIRTIPDIFRAVKTSGYSAAASVGPLGKTVAATGWQFASLKKSFGKLLPALKFVAPIALLAGAAFLLLNEDAREALLGVIGNITEAVPKIAAKTVLAI